MALVLTMLPSEYMLYDPPFTNTLRSSRSRASTVTVLYLTQPLVDASDLAVHKLAQVLAKLFPSASDTNTMFAFGSVSACEVAEEVAGATRADVARKLSEEEKEGGRRIGGRIDCAAI